MALQSVKAFLKRVLPAPVYRPLVGRWRRWRRRPLPHGGLSGLRPISAIWGLDRGTPIEVHYIERFLAAHASDIRGRVLEIGDARYTRKFGGGRIVRSDVLNLTPGNPEATLIGDLATGQGIPPDAFDCLIVVNTFLLIYDVRAAVANCRAALRPGGALLAHFTGIARRAYSHEPWGPPGWLGEGDYWRFTSTSARRLCEAAFGLGNVEVRAYGNVWTAAASLYGLAAEELSTEELEHNDPDFELAVFVRAVRGDAQV